MNFRQANTFCRDLCRDLKIRNPPRVIPLKFPHPFGRESFFDKYRSDVALGFNDQRHNRIELNRRALHIWDDSRVIDLLKHELVHKACYQRFPDYAGEHGDRFERVCLDLGFPDHIGKERM